MLAQVKCQQTGNTAKTGCLNTILVYSGIRCYAALHLICRANLESIYEQSANSEFAK